MKINANALINRGSKKFDSKKLKFFKNILHKNFSERRIVVTGMGTVNPLGVNTSESWNNLKKLTSGIRSLEGESFGNDLPGNCKIGATIPKHFEAKKYKTLVTIS